MSQSHSPDTPARPALAFRVGVTGTRDRTEQNWKLQQQVEDVLELIRRDLTCLARMSETRAAYRLEQDGQLRLELRLLSPLAEGSDRLVARAAIRQGYNLHVPMPFRREIYEKDFTEAPGSVDEFYELLASAEGGQLELDGARDDFEAGHYDESRAYEAVGRHIVRNCDLLIAIWDGKPEKGRGGTAQIVRYAMEAGPPVYWIHAERPVDPVWLDGSYEPRQRLDQPPGAEQSLLAYLMRLIVPPDIGEPHQHSIIERLTHACRRHRSEPLATYLSEQLLPRRWYWRAHAGLIKAVAMFKPSGSGPRETPDDPVAVAWYHHYLPADERSGRHGDRYRSVYVWIFGLVALSLVVSVAAMPFHESTYVEMSAGAIELVSLLIILCFLVASYRHDWHQRWIDYRLLAELCRKQQALAPLGWSLPARRIATLSEQAATVNAAPDRTAWVAWFFAAAVRAAPLPTGRFTGTTLSRALHLGSYDLVHEQFVYHDGRMTQYQKAGQHLVVFGEVLFLLVFVIVIAKLLIAIYGPGTEILSSLAVLAVILPTIAAASVGVRAYAELQILADQSLHMRGVMARAKLTLKALDLQEPLASQELGAMTLVVANTMLQEVDGWARMFRVKVVEAG